MSRIEQDALWHEQKSENGWGLPAPAVWPLRLPIVRNVRGAWNLFRAERHASMWNSVGVGIGMNPYDRWVLYAIYRGWA